jgi:hypothetical protein
MKHIFGASSFESVPLEFQAEFKRRLGVQNCRRALIINIICVSFVVLLFTLDYIRWVRHELFNSEINLALMVTHWLVALQAIPLWLISTASNREPLAMAVALPTLLWPCWR